MDQAPIPPSIKHLPYYQQMHIGHRSSHHLDKLNIKAKLQLLLFQPLTTANTTILQERILISHFKDPALMILILSVDALAQA